MAAKLDPELTAKRVYRWAEITFLALGIRGGFLLGPGHSDEEKFRAALAEARRRREARVDG